MSSQVSPQLQTRRSSDDCKSQPSPFTPTITPNDSSSQSFPPPNNQTPTTPQQQPKNYQNISSTPQPHSTTTKLSTLQTTPPLPNLDLNFDIEEDDKPTELPITPLYRLTPSSVSISGLKLEYSKSNDNNKHYITNSINGINNTSNNNSKCNNNNDDENIATLPLNPSPNTSTAQLLSIDPDNNNNDTIHSNTSSTHSNTSQPNNHNTISTQHNFPLSPNQYSSVRTSFSSHKPFYSNHYDDVDEDEESVDCFLDAYSIQNCGDDDDLV